jgi:hypothetical protein
MVTYETQRDETNLVTANMSLGWLPSDSRIIRIDLSNDPV